MPEQDNRVDVQTLVDALVAAGLPIVGAASTGRIDPARPFTPAEQDLAGQILAAEIARHT
ncbi:MAG: hypothetical protein GYA17_09775, partial [Chloroflexi bacterium]|nr:hypothetical protein [Chloroflexota bacterium]